MKNRYYVWPCCHDRSSSCIRRYNTAEMTAMIEALSFHGPRGSVARDTNSSVYDSKHAAGVCLGTILARTHVQLGLSCQQLLLKVQHRLRFTMQHICSHAENLGNESPRLISLSLVPELTATTPPRLLCQGQGPCPTNVIRSLRSKYSPDGRCRTGSHKCRRRVDIHKSASE